MMTPQEVASHSFSKATFGGYNMAMVDEFLDLLTADYTALYNDNAILKNKLKVLSDTVEEYRATDRAMRKTLLAAQQMADSIVSEAEQKKLQLEQETDVITNSRVAELQAAISAEEYRLHQAQESTAAYLKKLLDLHSQEIDFLNNLHNLVPPEATAPNDPTPDIEASVSALIYNEGKPSSQEVPIPTYAGSKGEPDASDDVGTETTRRFDDLQSGKDYEIT